MTSEVVGLFTELAALPSPPGDERAVADTVTRYLRDLGLTVDEDDAGRTVGSNSGNLYCRLDPTNQSPDFRITTGSTDWAATSSLIDPNFGDYTDNTSTGTRTYFIWSDGRIGVPQPFVDSRG